MVDFRRMCCGAALSAALIFALMGCTNTDPNGTARDDIWFSAATDPDQRWKLLERIRDVDPCALLPRDTLAQHGTVAQVRVGGHTITGCHAELKTKNTAVELNWSITQGTAASAINPTRQVDEVAIEVLPPEALGSAQCWVTAEFPAQVQIFLTIAAPKDQVDTCALGDSLIDTAIAHLTTSPQYGTSPDSARTVLTRANPCEVLPRLSGTPLTPVAQWQTVSICRFGDTDAPTAIEYAYQKPQDITADETTTLNGRTVYVARLGAGEFMSYTFTVGSPFAEDIQGTITVAGRDQAEVRRARDELMVLYPGN